MLGHAFSFYALMFIAVRRAACRRHISASWYNLVLHNIIFGNPRRSSSLPRPVSAPIPLLELGNGTDSIVMFVSSTSLVEIEPHVVPSFYGVVSPETGLGWIDTMCTDCAGGDHSPGGGVGLP